MKTVFAAAIMAAVNASSVHPFFAESNFACGMCQEALSLGAKENWSELERIYEIFPHLYQRISSYQGGSEMIDLSKPELSCMNIGLCDRESVAEMLLNELPVDLDKHIEFVNNHPNASWTAGTNDKFTGASRKEIRQTLGTVVDPMWTYEGHTKNHNLESTDFPTNFDAREHWPECEPVINHVRDQADCGSCWAHGTTEALNDRMCIATNGAFQELLSVADTTACCDGSSCFSFGCNGGQVGTPWLWFKNTGVVSGGDYGDDKYCFDYTMPQCAHHVTVEGMVSCDDSPQIAPKCKNTCQSNTSINYESDKTHADSSYNIRGIDNIKHEIMTYGTVTAAFTVYEDFLTYKSGVYQHVSGAAEGGHAIKMIGWGVEDGLDYWLCVNSWNNNWGDKGTFKIKMGACGINNQVHAGQA
jgi:cathepsin B